MDKNKQTKKRKLKTKHISIAMLAIILVTFLAVPTSAVDAESVIGTWVFNEYLVLPSSTMSEASFGDLTGTFHLVNSETKEIYDAPIGSLTVNNDYSIGVKINSGDGGNNGYPTIDIINAEVRIQDNRTHTAYYSASSASITAEDYQLLRTITIESYTPSGNDAQAFSDFLEANATKAIPPPPEPDPLGNILDVFLGIGGWIATAVTSLIGIFYSAEAGKLTVIGVLSVASLAISVIFLLIGVIQNFMHFRS